MSMIRCDRCGDRVFDTDEDVEGYSEVYDQWVCPLCRCPSCGSANYDDEECSNCGEQNEQ